jgi:hypothetical protein
MPLSSSIAVYVTFEDKPSDCKYSLKSTEKGACPFRLIPINNNSMDSIVFKLLLWLIFLGASQNVILIKR